MYLDLKPVRKVTAKNKISLARNGFLTFLVAYQLLFAY